MASHEINPLELPPESLRQVLKSIKEEMKQNPRLELPYDQIRTFVLLQHNEGKSYNHG